MHFEQVFNRFLEHLFKDIYGAMFALGGVCWPFPAPFYCPGSGAKAMSSVRAMLLSMAFLSTPRSEVNHMPF